MSGRHLCGLLAILAALHVADRAADRYLLADTVHARPIERCAEDRAEDDTDDTDDTDTTDDRPTGGPLIWTL